MRRENEKLIIDGNAIYELDLECVRRKNQQKDKESSRSWREKNSQMPGIHKENAWNENRRNENTK